MPINDVQNKDSRVIGSIATNWSEKGSHFFTMQIVSQSKYFLKSQK